MRGNTHKLNGAIRDLWSWCLQQYPRAETKDYVRLPSKSLNTNVWFATYLNLMEHFATKNSAFVRWIGWNYQKSHAVDRKYVENLPVPGSSKLLNYEELFEQTRQNLLQAWTGLAEALKNDDAALFTLRNGSLDTGRDEAGQYVCWS